MKWTLDNHPVAMATRLEAIEWYNREREELEWAVKITIYTEEGVFFITYRAKDFNNLIGDEIEILKTLIERGFDAGEGR